MNIGDMLVKSGDWQTAIKIYNNAKLSKTYSAWPYRKMLSFSAKHMRTLKFNATFRYYAGFLLSTTHGTSI